MFRPSVLDRLFLTKTLNVLVYTHNLFRTKLCFLYSFNRFIFDALYILNGIVPLENYSKLILRVIVIDVDHFGTELCEMTEL